MRLRLLICASKHKSLQFFAIFYNYSYLEICMAIVTVIMAAYNAAKTLDAAVESVLAQSLSDIELLIVNDASSDATLAVAESLRQRDSRVRVLSRSENGGPAAARNTALDAATGTWIAVVDADDVILPERLEHMVRAAEAAQADIIFDNLLYIEGYTERLYIPAYLNLAGPLSLQDYILSHRRACPIPNLGFLKPLFRRDRLDASGLRYDTSLKIGEDAMLVMALMAAGAKACLLSEAWYRYFRHKGSISARQDHHSLYAINKAFRTFLRGHEAALPPVTREIVLALMTENEWRMMASELAMKIRKGSAADAFLALLRHPRVGRFLIHELAGQLRHAFRGAKG